VHGFLVIFEIGSHYFAQAQAWIAVLLFMLPATNGITSLYHHTHFSVKMGCHKLFAKAGMEPQFSGSQPPTQLDLCHHTQLAKVLNCMLF
jgi:hypothetical protein